MRVNPLTGVGKILIIVGVLFIIMGAFFLAGGKLNWLGRLPGDIYIKREGFSFFFPITTSILISLVISLLLRLLR